MIAQEDNCKFYCNVCGQELRKYIDGHNRIRVVECGTCETTTGYINRDSVVTIKSTPKTTEPIFIHNTFKEDITKRWQKRQSKRGKKF